MAARSEAANIEIVTFSQFLAHHHNTLAPFTEPRVAHAGHSVVELALNNAPKVIMMKMIMITLHLRSSRPEKYPRSLVVPRTLKMYSVLSRLTSRLRLW